MTDLVAVGAMTVPMPGQMTKVYEMDARRRWSDAEKAAIIEESRSAPVARVAKKHGVAVSLLFRWRRLEGIRARRPVTAPVEGFVQLTLPAPARADAVAREHTIEIVLACGHRVIVGQDVDGAALKRVIAALEA